MFKRMIPVLLALMMLPALALAESPPVYPFFTFAEVLPEPLTEPLSGYIPADSHIITGAVIQHNSIDVEPDEPGSMDACSALVLVDMTDGLHLIAAAWVDSLPWQVNDYSCILRRQENVSIGIYQPEPNRIPQFRVDYPAQNGLISDLVIFRGNRLWQLSGHINEAAGVNIAVNLGTIRLIDAQGRNDSLCLEYFWLDYLSDINAFPTNRTDVLALEAAA